MIYVYCEAKSNGAKELVEQLDGIRLRQFDGMDFWRKGKRVKLNKGDVVVCWGRPAPEFEGILVLNSGIPTNKLDDLRTFGHYGVATVQYTTNQYPGYLPRKKFHIGGDDLLNPPSKPDFWVKKYDFKNEYRLHSFDGKSIRAGRKVPRAGYTIAESEEKYRVGVLEGRLVAHPWIRSYDAGWMIDYSDFTSPEYMRKLAHQAVETLELTFGAVDIGEIVSPFGDPEYLVLEVNRAPGIEGNTISTYVKAINKWIEMEPIRQKVYLEQEKKLDVEGASQLHDHPLQAQLERQAQNARRDAAQLRRVPLNPPPSIRRLGINWSEMAATLQPETFRDIVQSMPSEIGHRIVEEEEEEVDENDFPDLLESDDLLDSEDEIDSDMDRGPY